MIAFAKAHAYGNDFIYVEKGDVRDRPLAPLAQAMCDRRTGIGADGLILYSPTPDGATMSLLNADGSGAEVSGNGLRGLAALLLRGFREVRIVPERFPVKSRLHGGWKGAVYNGLFVGTFNALPRRLVRRFGWHLLAFCRK